MRAARTPRKSARAKTEPAAGRGEGEQFIRASGLARRGKNAGRRAIFRRAEYLRLGSRAREKRGINKKPAGDAHTVHPRSFREGVRVACVNTRNGRKRLSSGRTADCAEPRCEGRERRSGGLGLVVVFSGCMVG